MCMYVTISTYHKEAPLKYIKFFKKSMKLNWNFQGGGGF